jgi:sulfur-carrier protein adenylyltransferase/sulfurtransferase
MTDPLEILPETLLEWHQNNQPIILIDVRTLAERNAFNIGGQHIEVNELLHKAPQINTTQPIIFYCAKGIRSYTAALHYQQLGYNNVFSLKGGMGYWQFKNLPHLLFI